jgi:hypothetical protein
MSEKTGMFSVKPNEDEREAFLEAAIEFSRLSAGESIERQRIFDFLYRMRDADEALAKARNAFVRLVEHLKDGSSHLDAWVRKQEEKEVEDGECAENGTEG